MISELLGIKLDSPPVKRLQIKDCENRPHTFFIHHTLPPAGQQLRAFELNKEGHPDGYIFSVRGDWEEKMESLFEKLLQKIKAGLATKYLEDSDGEYRIKNREVVGRIEYQSLEESTGPDVVIDGKRFSWEEFGRMVYMFEGWNFRLVFEDE
ncbi:MAG: DUF7713 domain-containing protein [Desulfofundulus sp.]